MYWKDLPNVDANFALVAGRAISFSKNVENLLKAIMNDDSIRQMDPTLVKRIKTQIHECGRARYEAEERFEKRNEPTITKRLSNQ